jgi:hypothetical protein
VPAAAPVRTTFAITLQLGRAYPALLRLVAAGYTGARAAGRDAAVEIAETILRGARDRSRDAHLRPVLDQQRRTESLTRLRKRRRSSRRSSRKTEGAKVAA